MTYEEAIKSLQNIIEYWTYKPSEVEAAKIAISAIEKQISQKPKIDLKRTINFNTKCTCPS